MPKSAFCLLLQYVCALLAAVFVFVFFNPLFHFVLDEQVLRLNKQNIFTSRLSSFRAVWTESCIGFGNPARREGNLFVVIKAAFSLQSQLFFSLV